MALIGEFNQDLEIYLAENKGRIGASRQSSIDIQNISAKSKGILLNLD